MYLESFLLEARKTYRSEHISDNIECTVQYYLGMTHAVLLRCPTLY